MNTLLGKVLICLVITQTLIACSSMYGTGKYRVQTIGNAQRSVRAVVLSAEPVYIQGGTSGVGAALGATAGGGIAAGGSDNAAVIIAGIILGAVIGDYIEGQDNVYPATQYVIETTNGILLTVAQIDDGNRIFNKGNKVVLVHGYPNRLIADPSDI